MFSFVYNSIYIVQIILFALIIYTLLRTLYNIYKAYVVIQQRNEHISDLKSNILSLTDLCTLTPLEFKKWCLRFILSNNNFSNLDTIESTDKFSLLIGEKNGKCCLVNCNYTFDNNVDVTIVAQLIGAMKIHNVSNGVLITRSNLSEEANTFVKSLPSDISLKVYTGDNLIENYSNHLRTKLQVS